VIEPAPTLLGADILMVAPVVVTPSPE